VAALSLALLSALSGALANLLARRLMRQTPLRAVLALNFAIIFALLLPLAPFYFTLRPHPAALRLLALAIGLDAAANYAYFRAFESNDAVTASTLLALSPLFTLLAALGVGSPSALHPLQAAGVLLSSGGTLWLIRSAPNTNADAAPRAPGRMAWLYPLLAAALFGLSLYPIKDLFTQGWINPPTYYLVRAGVIALLAAPLARGAPDRPPLRLLTVRALLVIAQWLALLFALQSGSPAAVKAVADASPLFVLLLTALVHRRAPERSAWGGTLLVVLGIILLGAVR